MSEKAQAQDLIDKVLPLIEARQPQVWLVGGWVRDWLLDRPTRDVDFVVPAAAVAVARQVADDLGAAFVALDQERDTARVVLGPPQAATYLDFSGLRAPTIEADLLARDFTINAMAVPAADWRSARPRLIDPSGGQDDLARRVVRAVSAEAFRQDPLRLLRAVRLAWLLGFAIEPQTEAWLRRDAELLEAVSRERVRDELVQMLALPEAAQPLRQLHGLGLLAQVLPEVARLEAVATPGGADPDVLAHSLRTLDLCCRVLAWLESGRAGQEWPLRELETCLSPYRDRLGQRAATALAGGRTVGTLLALAALLHDAGKEGSTPQGGRVLGHEVLGASVAATVMRRLCFSSAEIVRVRDMVANHLRPGQLARESGGEPSRRAIYRFFREAEPAGPETILLSLADHLATRGGEPYPEHWRLHLDVCARLLHAYYERHGEIVQPVPIIDGRELMAALGLHPGPEVGELLESIREAQAAGEVHSRDDALDLAQEMLARGAPL